MSHGFGFLVLVLLGGLALAGMFRGLLEGFEAPKDEQNAGSVPVTGSAKLVLGPASLGPASLGPASHAILMFLSINNWRNSSIFLLLYPLIWFALQSVINPWRDLSIASYNIIKVYYSYNILL